MLNGTSIARKMGNEAIGLGIIPSAIAEFCPWFDLARPNCDDNVHAATIT